MTRKKREVEIIPPGRRALDLVKSWAKEHCLYLSFDAPDYVGEIKYEIKQAVKAERERCAKVAERAAFHRSYKTTFHSFHLSTFPSTETLYRSVEFSFDKNTQIRVQAARAIAKRIRRGK